MRGGQVRRSGRGWSRRDIIRAGLGGLALPGGLGMLASTAWAGVEGRGDPELIVRNPRPLDAETPVEAFESWLTPNRLFFVRSHFGPPAVGLSPWRLDVGGMVERPLALGVEDLGRFETVKLPAVLQCSGNGRGSFSPKVPGVAWDRGAVGNAEWGGVRLADLLGAAGVREGAAHVHLQGADGPPSPKTPAFLRSIPLDRALDRSTLIATTMNGEPLPILHGGPLRLIVPTWTGNHWIKWLRTIRVDRLEAPGFYQQTGYRMPKHPTPPGADVPPGDLVPVTTMNVKSLIASPSRGAKVEAGRRDVRGVAWTGEGVIAKVEVAIDDFGWKEANPEGPERVGAWRLWSFPWDASRPGRHEIRVRATDSTGKTQPETTPWNKSGYLWNGIDRITCEVV